MMSFSTMPKGELHAHLLGCVPSAAAPAGPRPSLAEYLEAFTALKPLTRSRRAVHELTAEAARTLAADGVVYAELRASPTKIAAVAGVSTTDALSWLLDAFDAASGATGVDLRLVLNLNRVRDVLEDARTLLHALSRRWSPRVVGIDVSGEEEIAPPRWLAPLLRTARSEFGLGITVHAGETGSRESLRWALCEAQADRIGHGLALVDDAALQSIVRERQVCVEVCMTSNVRSGQVGSIEMHPVRYLVDSGMPFVLCSDNPALHGRTLSDDYAAFVEATGRRDIIADMYRRQQQYAFGAAPLV